MGDINIELAEREILSAYGDVVSVKSKAKSLHKFGQNDDVDTARETVWNQGGNESYVTGNTIDQVSSSSGSDTVELTIEGHTVTGSGVNAQFTFVIQTVTLTGQTAASLSTALARVSRVANLSGTSLVGDVYVSDSSATTLTAGVPQTAAGIHAKVNPTENQTEKAATTFSNLDYFLLTRWEVGIRRASGSAVVDFNLERRSVGGVFRPMAKLTTTNTRGSIIEYFEPPLIIPKNADIRITANSSAANTPVNASFSGYLAKIITNLNEIV